MFHDESWSLEISLLWVKRQKVEATRRHKIQVYVGLQTQRNNVACGIHKLRWDFPAAMLAAQAMLVTLGFHTQLYFTTRGSKENIKHNN